MKITEIIESERKQGCMFITLRGMFYTAYDGSAQALSRITGYKVKRIELKDSPSNHCYCGFPADSIGKVMKQLEAAGGKIGNSREGQIRMDGIDNPFDVDSCAEYEPRGDKKSKKYDPKGIEELKIALRDFDPASHTPLEAMNFLCGLREEILR